MQLINAFYLLNVMNVTALLFFSNMGMIVQCRPIGNESVLKIVINSTLNLFFLKCNQHFGNFKP